MRIKKVEIKGNVPGKDTRGITKPASKAKHTGISLKEAVMGRSKLPTKVGTQRTAILD